jgi:hypothetical protein
LLARKLFSFFVVFWLGMIVGVSFFSAPVKFLAPSLTKPVALEIGDLSFRYFNYIEWGLCFVLLILVVGFLRNKLTSVLVLSLVAVLAMDSFYLLPDLHEYVLAVSGETEIPNIALQHKLYVVGDFYKVLVLIGILFVKL